MNTSSYSEISDHVRKELRRIEQAIYRGDLKFAASALTELNRRAPEDWRIHLIGIQLAEAAGNIDAARESARRAYEAAPQAVTAVIEWARILSRDGEHDKATNSAKQAAESCADDDELVLSRAVAIANVAGDWELARFALQKAHRARPDDLPVLRALGYNALNRRELPEALDWFQRCLQILPKDELALAGRAWARVELGQKQEAAEDYAMLEGMRPGHEEYSYYGAIARGETPATQPLAITKTIVEGYARVFDELVTGQLGYFAPRRAAELIHQEWPAKNASVLDLGCGTGLLGAYLGPIEGSLVGVDFSQTMLDQAKLRGYDRLHHCDLRDALRDTPELQYEVIVACDVFIYVGKIDEAMQHAARILRPNGMVIATFELSEQEPYVLRGSARYAHGKEYVREALTSAGLTEIAFEDLTIRHEAGQPIPGFIATARKRVRA